MGQIFKESKPEGSLRASSPAAPPPPSPVHCLQMKNGSRDPGGEVACGFSLTGSTGLSNGQPSLGHCKAQAPKIHSGEFDIRYFKQQ